MERKKTLAAITVLVVCLACVGVSNFGQSFDDAYITYRYALNLARGNGFVYNIGERHLGTTSPLFTLLLALGGLFYPSIPFWGWLFSILALGACAWFAFLLLSRAASFWAGFLAIPLVILNPVLIASLGNETTLLLAFLLGQYYCYQIERRSLFAILSALGTLTRGEGLLLLLIFLWYDFHRQIRLRQFDSYPLAIYIFILIPWLLFSRVYFGAFLPSTLNVKMTMTRIPGSIWTPFFQNVVSTLPGHLSPTTWGRILLFSLSLTGAIGALVYRKFVALLFFFLAYFLSYGILRVAGFPWYEAPLALAVSFFGVYGAHSIALARWAPPTAPKPHSGLRFLRAWLLHLEPDFSPHSVRYGIRPLLIFFLLGAVLTYSITRRGVEFKDDRLAPYREAGLWLKENAAEGATVGIPEVGIIGYYSGLRMMDIDGLIFPPMSAPGRMHNYQYLIRTYLPDYIISQERAPYPELRPGDIHPGVHGLACRYILVKQVRYAHRHVAIWKRTS